MAYIWKKPAAFSAINSFLNYFNIVVFFQDNVQMYLVVFYFLIALVYLVIADIVYVSYIFSQNKIGAVWPLRLLRSVVSFIVTTLFLPLVEFFVAIIECSNIDPDTGEVLDYYYNNNIADYNCWEGSFYIHAAFATITSIIFCSICIIVQMIFYETKTDVHNQEAKTNSKADLFALYVKICCIIMFSFLVFNKTLHWIIVISIFLLSLVQFYIYFTERPFYDERMIKAYLILTGLFLWNNTVLLLGKILVDTSFDGCIELFLIGTPIVVTIILLQPDRRYTLLLTNLNKIERGDLVIKQVRYFLELVDKKEKDRKCKLLLKGFIHVHCETCTLIDCPLKHYLQEKNEADGVVFLYQHAQSMFQNAIYKFPSCTSLRMSYAFFLMERMNNKRLSLHELRNAEKHEPNFEEQFIIFRFNKLLEEQANESDQSEEGELDIVSTIAYKNHFMQFKSGISKATSLYTEFWSNLLVTSSQDSDEDFEKMNEFGSKINQTVESIKNNFEKMQKIKSVDVEAFYLYSEFLSDVLNDKENAKIYKNRLNEQEDNKNSYLENQQINFDINLTPKNDEYQYIVLSADIQSLGVILKVSTGICTIFGYSKTDLLGKHIEFLMPDQYHDGHKLILQEKVNQYKKSVALTLSTHPNQKGYKATTKEIFVFGKNSSRYLVPLNMKVSLMPSPDKSEVFFVSKLTEQDTLEIKSSKTKVCYVLTNADFIIQNFTANAMNILGLNSNSQGTMDLTKTIKDFTEDFYRLELQDKTKQEILSTKRHIISSNYHTPSKVIWITTIFDKTSITDVAKQRRNSDNNTVKNQFKSTIVNKTPIMRNKYKEEFFMMSSSEICMNDNFEGFIFKFETIPPKEKEGSNTNLNTFSLPYALGRGTTDKMYKEVKKRLQTKNSNSSDEELVDQNFIPKDENKFELDSRTLTFVNNPKNVEKLKEFSKQEATKKLHNLDIEKERKRLENEEEMHLRDDGTVSSSDSESSSKLSQDSNNSSSIDSSERTPKPHLKDLNDYYHVNIDVIDFLIYDYKKNEIIEIPLNIRESQMEFRKNEDTKIKHTKPAKETEKKEAKRESDSNISEEKNLTSNDVILMKQIEYALSKIDTQPEVVKMKLTSFSIFIILIIFTSIFFAFFLTNQSDLSDILNLIINSNKMIANLIVGSFYTRELVLLNNEKYTNFLLPDRSQSFKNISQTMLNLFSETYSIHSQIITSSLPFVSSSNKTSITLSVILDSLSTIPITLFSSPAKLEALTSLYHIANLNVNMITPTNKHVYFYLSNSLNNILLLLQDEANYYMEQSTVSIVNKINQFNYVLIAISLLCILFFIFLKLTHFLVVHRKSSYLEVFFYIETDVIKKSMDKCEKFSSKLTSDEMADRTDTIGELQDSRLVEEEKQEEEDSTKVQPNNKKTRKDNTETRSFTFQCLFGLFIVFLFYLLITLFYSNYMNTYINLCNFYNVTANEQAYYLFSFNILREYLFDNTSYVKNQPVAELVTKKIDENYLVKFERDLLVNKYFDSLPYTFQTYFKTTQMENLCYYTGDLFTNRLANEGITCETFFANSTAYGLDVLLTDYFEELRETKFKFDLFVKNSKPDKKMFNNTLYHSQFERNLSKPENHKDPFFIFNDQIVRNLGFFNIYLIKPIFENLLTKLGDSISSFKDTYKFIYISLFSLFLALVCFVYFVVIRPFENNLNDTIYKTKNMLAIIPKDVLASLPNINKLLDIGSNYIKKASKKNKKNSEKNYYE